jgi:hypothetical protein
VATTDDVGGDLPFPLGGSSGEVPGAVGVPASDIDVMVDRSPFWLAIGTDTPYERATAQWQKEQTDQQPEAGEQSLAGWWTRSQMSFHYGAGLTYLDTTARPQPEDRLRFSTSRNVDVWTPGVVRRLNGTILSRPHVASRVWVEPTPTGWIVAWDNGVEVYDGATWTTRNYGTTQPIRAFCTDGVNYYAATPDGVWSASLSGTATATKSYTLSGDLPMCLGWVKQRLMLGFGASVYSLDTAGPALPTPKMTHPLPSWRWSAFTDSPSGILATGYAGQSSAVFRFELTTLNDAPVLGPGIALLSLPLGEIITSACYYLGSVLILGTSRGIRVSSFDTYYGTMSLGPLSVETAAPVTTIAGYDRYVFGGTRVAGETSLVRVDLGAPLDDQGHYAWAPDLVFPDFGTWTEPPTSIAFGPSGRKAIGVSTRGLVLEDTDTNPSESAWLQLARIRMGTVEDKTFSYATLRGDYDETKPIGVSVQHPGSTEWASVYVATVSSERFALHSAPQEWIALRFDFSEGAELASYQVQALPAGKRQRLISLPLRLADYETTRSNVQVGYPGWALDRLRAIEHLDELGSEFSVSVPALFPEAVLCVIDRVSFSQTTGVGDSMSGTTGVVTLLLRTTG